MPRRHRLHRRLPAAALRPGAEGAGLLNACAFFFHLPFPSAALLRRIPEHRQLIASLLFYDLIGFTTTDDRNAFLSCTAAEFPLEMLPDDQIRANGHIFATGIFPAGINGRQVY